MRLLHDYASRISASDDYLATHSAAATATADAAASTSRPSSSSQPLSSSDSQSQSRLRTSSSGAAEVAREPGQALDQELELYPASCSSGRNLPSDFGVGLSSGGIADVAQLLMAAVGAVGALCEAGRCSLTPS